MRSLQKVNMGMGRWG